MSYFKKAISFGLAAIMALSLVACGNDASNSQSETPLVAAPNFSNGITEDGQFENIDLSQYVTLPEDYKNLTITSDKLAYDASEWLTYYNRILSAYGTKAEADGPIENGSVVTMNFKGTVDGVPFVGGSGENIEFMAGKNQYLPEIEEGVMGHVAGDKFSVEVTFPDGYPASQSEDGVKMELAGKTAVFEIEIVSVGKLTLTDETIAEKFADQKTMDGDDITSLEILKNDFDKSMKQSMLERAVTEKISEDATITEIPQVLLDNYFEVEKGILDANAKAVGFSSTEDFLKQNGFDGMEDYKSFVMKEAEQTIRSQMVLLTVAKENNIIPDKALGEVVFGKPYDELVEQFGEPYVIQNIVLYQALDMLCEGAVIEEVPAAEGQATADVGTAEDASAASEEAAAE